MTSNWAANLFKGRIGEAVIEAILSEFGYRVERAGYEQVSTGNTPAAPDLLVTHPRHASAGMSRSSTARPGPQPCSLMANG